MKLNVDLSGYYMKPRENNSYPIVEPWCSGYHYWTTLFIKA